MSDDLNPIPPYLRLVPPAPEPVQPEISKLIVVDKRVSLGLLLRALSDAGIDVINDRTGRLVVTCSPEDYREGRPAQRAGE